MLFGTAAVPPAHAGFWSFLKNHRTSNKSDQKGGAAEDARDVAGPDGGYQNEPSKATESGSSGQNSAGQSSAGQNSAGQSSAGQNSAGQPTVDKNAAVQKSGEAGRTALKAVDKKAGRNRKKENAAQNRGKRGRFFTTVASWYGSLFRGKKTASGKAFDPNAMTAASRTLPLGSKVRVSNPSTGKSATVTINDRVPFVKGRGIDLSAGAAKKIGLKGVAPVVCDTAPKTPAVATPVETAEAVKSGSNSSSSSSSQSSSPTAAASAVDSGAPSSSSSSSSRH